MFPLRTFVIASMLFSLASCATRPPIPHEQTSEQAFRIEEDLVGHFVAKGEFRPRFGGDIRGVTATLNGSWDGQTYVLVEDFVYSDGETDRKTWRLTPDGKGEWTGTREDVVGVARGYEDGKAFRLEYNVVLGGRTVGFRDVLVQSDNGVIYNKANVGYLGLAVGGVELFISPQP